MGQGVGVGVEGKEVGLDTHYRRSTYHRRTNYI